MKLLPRTGKFLVLSSLVGAAVQYLFDPRQGEGRRARAKDRAVAMLRRAGRRAERGIEGGTQYAKDRMHGLQHELTSPERMPENDRVLVDKVRSEVLGAATYDGTTINVNAVEGVVTLRGELQTPADINELVDAVSKVVGVKEVKSYLHLPNTAAPNKRDALEGSDEAVRKNRPSGVVD